MTQLFAWLWSLLAVLPGFGASPPPGFSGYVEAKYVYVAPTTAGVLLQVPVAEGETVKRGQLLFVQEQRQLEAVAAAADAQASAAEANWLNTTTGGRAEELAAGQAAVTKAKADLGLAQSTLDRSQKLYASNTVTEAQLDQDRAAVSSAQAALNQATANLAVLALPSREEQQKAAQADFAAARASADKAHADLADRRVVAPVDGRIERIFYDPGEMAPGGTPVLSILPAGALKVEFYVAEPDRLRLALGGRVAVSCDGCPSGLAGKLSFLASDPQYTSPIIYSRDERRQLTFLAEATLTDPGNILPGQPVTVSPSP